MKRETQDNYDAIEGLDEPSQKSNRFRSQKHPIGVVVIAIIIALALTGNRYSLTSLNKTASVASSPASNIAPRDDKEDVPSLAVMPFLNTDPQLDYLSDGITEMLIDNLSQLPILDVKAPASVFRYKDKGKTPHNVGTDLNVQAVLNGRMVLVGDALELTLELADAQTENLIWSGKYFRKQNDLIALQSEIARDV